MTREAIKRLLIVVELALLLLTVTLAPPVHAAQSSQPASPMSTIFSPLDVTGIPISGKTFLIAAVCLILLLFLSVLLFISILRKRRSKPISSFPPADPSPPATGPYLESVGTAGSSHRLNLKPSGVTIGRASENDLVITQDFPEWETVSQRHAWVYQWDDHWIIEDINSTNGIHVNGKRTGRNLLRDGWQLDIGGAEFIFRANTEETKQ